MTRFGLTRSRAVVLGCAACLAVGGTAAHAATPDSGTVSHASPKTAWTGTVANSYFNRVPVLLTDLAGEGDAFPCLPTTCDAFNLTVGETDDLVLTADAPESTSTDGSAGSQVTLRIFRPDGSAEIHSTEASGATPEKPLVVKIKKAPAGAWKIEYFNYFYGGDIEYNATATLGSPVAVTAPTTAPPSVEQPGLTVDVKAAKLSAAKVNRAKKLATTVTVSRQVKSVAATLKAGSKTVGKGTLGSFSGSKKLSLKLSKKLKKGTYALTVVADDGAGTLASKTLALKVAK